MLSQQLFQTLRHHRDAILTAFAFAHCNLVLREVDVFHTQSQQLAEPHPRAVRTRLIRQPGQPGTKQLVEQYGAKLVCVRYRYDEDAGKRYKTIELIIDESPYAPSRPKIKPETIVGVRIGLQETDWQRK